MHVPDFWDDQSIAQKVSTQYSRLKGRLEQYKELATLVDDLELLLELAHEESDDDVLSPETMAELERVSAAAARDLDHFEEQRLFNGEFDTGDAIVSIHPGAGGTESQELGRDAIRRVSSGRRGAVSRWRSTRLRKVTRPV